MSEKCSFNTEDNNLRFVVESAMAKLEKSNIRLWVVCIILILALIGSNAGWIYYESTFNDIVVTQEVDAMSDGDSDLNINTIGGDNYGGESTRKTDS